MSAEDTARQVAALREELRELVASGRLQVEDGGPHRLNLSEVTRALLAAINRQATEHSSVRLHTNARGDTQVEVVVRTGESPEVVTVDDAAAKAAEVYDRLRLVYPVNTEPIRDDAGSAKTAAKAAAIATRQAASG